MGDIADMHGEQYWDDPGGDDVGLYDYGGRKTCRYCGKSGLHWHNVGSVSNPRWRLVSNDRQTHQCRNFRRGKNDRND